MDSYSKFLFSFKLVNKTAISVFESLKIVINIVWRPLKLQTDDGREFAYSVLETWLAYKDIRFIRGRPRHPQNQGQIERLDKNIGRKLRML